MTPWTHSIVKWLHPLTEVILEAGIMKTRASAALLLGACLTGCGILGLGDEEYLIRVDSLSVPHTVGPQDSIPVHVFGWVGPDGCHSFSHFQVKKTPPRARIGVWGEESHGGDCTMAPVELDQVHILRPPFTDPFLVAIRQPSGLNLEATVRIR